MSGGKHTPGPWLDWRTLEWRRDPQELLEDTANARLMAAAPELLAACKAINAVATFPQWTAGDCRLCKYDFQSGHAPDCPYALAEAQLIFAITLAQGITEV